MKYAITRQGAAEVVQLSGDLNEDVEDTLQALRGELSANEVVFDLTRVGTLNSTGTAAWVRFITPVAKGRKLSYRNCSAVFLGYAGLVSGLLGGGRVESVSVPYVCDGCNRRASVTRSYAEACDPAQTPASCAKCKQDMAIDGDIVELLVELNLG